MKQTLFSAISGAIKDGVIVGVSVITKGQAKGHGLTIDDTTLETVLASAAEFKDGVQVKIDHGTGFGSIVGSLKNFRVDGESLRADLHLLKSHSDFDKIIEIAETMPGSVGLSISFSGKSEKVDGETCARCAELYSVDFVSTPAANPNGLFSQPIDSPQNNSMAEKFDSFVAGLKSLVGASDNIELVTAKTELATASAKVTELSAKISEITAQLTAANEKASTLEKAQAEFDKKVELAASAKAQQISASQGVPAITAIPAANPADTKPKSDKTGFARVHELINLEIGNTKRN